LADLRYADFGAGFNLAMLIFGEFNAFHPTDAGRILEKAHAALAAGGRLLLEVQTEEDVKAQGCRSPRWFTAQSSVYSDQPHLCLMESFWHPDPAVTVNRYFVVAARTQTVEQMNECLQAYSMEQYRALLSESGFEKIETYPSLAGVGGPCQAGMFVISALRS
jgi:hypothetical protein